MGSREGEGEGEGEGCDGTGMSDVWGGLRGGAVGMACAKDPVRGTEAAVNADVSSTLRNVRN